MADRVLRGSRLGAVSYETDRNHDLAPRQIARYRTENGEEFDVPFADDAEIPHTWLCRNGMEGTLIEGDTPEPKKVKPPRTHWDMLLERRSIDELEELLKERLDIIKQRRRGSERRSTAAAPRARSNLPRTPHWATLTIASRILEPLILEIPNSRSTNVIGTSTTMKPSLIVRQVKSIWKQ
jgi:hypothetical protein